MERFTQLQILSFYVYFVFFSNNFYIPDIHQENLKKYKAETASTVDNLVNSKKNNQQTNDLNIWQRLDELERKEQEESTDEDDRSSHSAWVNFILSF